MAYSSWSPVIEYKNGKFRSRVNYSISGSSFVWTFEIDVTDKPSEKLYYFVRFGDDVGGWSEWSRTNVKRNVDYVSEYSRTSNRLELKVQFGVGTGSSPNKIGTIPSVTRTSNAPTSISVRKLNDAHYTIDVGGRGYEYAQEITVTVERATDTQSSWSVIGSETTSTTGTYSMTFDDQDTSAGHKYWYRAKASTQIGGDSQYITSSEQYTSPTTGQNANATINGNRATVTWSVSDVSEIDRGIIEGWYVERSANGGSYIRVGTVRANASQYNYTYTETVDTGANYDYRIVAYGGGGSSYDSGGSSSVETAPSAPYSVSAYRNASDNVVIDISDSSSNTATNVIIERSVDGGAWTQIASEDFPLESYTDTSALASDSIKYRIKNTNSAGSSDYRESNTVLVKSKPNAPSLITPVNGAVVDLEEGTVRLVWRHNSTDGSPQRQAELQYKIGSGSWTTVTKTTESYTEVSLSGRSANEVITWRARTKGSHADWSDYSVEYTFTLLQKPEIHVISPVNAEAISELPVYVQYSYNDNSGTLEELEIDIIKDAEVVKTFVDEDKTGEYSLAGFLFDNDSVYGIRVRALSSSGLRTDDLVSITIQYEVISIEGGLLLTIVGDDNGYAYVTITRDITGGVEPVDIAEAYLYRLHDGERALLGEVEEGSQIIDKLAPLNVEYRYELLQLTEDGEISIVRVGTLLKSHCSFIYFGDEIFKGKWNPEFNISLDRSERVLKRYSGRKYPVSYDSEAMDETCNYSTVLVDRSEVVRLKQLMRKGNGQGIWKSADGDSYYAVFSASYDTDRYYSPKHQTWNVSISVTRIEDK